MFTDRKIAAAVEDNELEGGVTYASITKTEKNKFAVVSAKKMKKSF